MKYIQLMDCTMRDGGWVNEFSFGTEGMRDILQNYNVGSFQGYYYAKPLMLDQFYEWEEEHNNKEES